MLFLTIAGLGIYLIGRTPLPALSALKPVAGCLFGLLLVVLFAVNGVRNPVLLVRNRPVFRLGVLGIQLGTGPLDPWESIREEKVVATTGRYGNTLLSYFPFSHFTFDVARRLNVTECAISASTLAEQLRYYGAHALGTAAAPSRRQYNR